MSDNRNANAAAGPAGAVYGMGFIGALVYFIQTTHGFTDGLYGLFQAIFWPGYLVYAALKSLGF